MLRASVERDPGATAVLEVGGASLSYGELWERAARVAGGLRGAGVERGDRVAIRLRNGIDWVLAFFGAQLLGAVVVPVNTRFTEEEVAYVVERLRRRVHLRRRARRCPTASRVGGRGPRARRPGGDLLHERHHRLPEGRDDLARELPDQQRERVPLPVRSTAPRAPSISTLVSVPLFHVTGCNSQLIPLLELGGRVEILSGPLDFDGFFTRGRRARRQPARVGARDLPRGAAPPALRRARRQRRALGLLRRRPDRREPRARGSRRRSPTPAWATASGSPRPPR